MQPKQKMNTSSDYFSTNRHIQLIIQKKAIYLFRCIDSLIICGRKFYHFIFNTIYTTVTAKKKYHRTINVFILPMVFSWFNFWPITCCQNPFIHTIYTPPLPPLCIVKIIYLYPLL